MFVTTELLDVSQEVRLSVVDNLKAEHGDLYTLDNVVISATHTQSSPGGYRHDGAYREAYFKAVVAGITRAIEDAHADLQPGRILLGQARSKTPARTDRQSPIVKTPRASAHDTPKTPTKR